MFCIQLLLFVTTYFHPFYVSVTDVHYNEKSKTIEVSSKIFFDDLEKILIKDYQTKIDILKPKDKNEVNRLIAQYLKKHLQLKINNKLYAMKYLGYEIQEDAAWCYLEIPKMPKVSTIEVFNDVLFKMHPQQVNMLNVSNAIKKQSAKLDNPEDLAKFNF